MTIQLIDGSRWSVSSDRISVTFPQGKAVLEFLGRTGVQKIPIENVIAILVD
jgi:hypothetical protein